MLLDESQHCMVATALTVYGIETLEPRHNKAVTLFCVATALTVYDIETI